MKRNSLFTSTELEKKQTNQRVYRTQVIAMSLAESDRVCEHGSNKNPNEIIDTCKIVIEFYWKCGSRWRFTYVGVPTCNHISYSKIYDKLMLIKNKQWVSSPKIECSDKIDNFAEVTGQLYLIISFTVQAFGWSSLWRIKLYLQHCNGTSRDALHTTWLI